MKGNHTTPKAFELIARYAEHEGSIRLVKDPSESEIRSHHRNLGVYIAVFFAIFVAMLLT